MKLLIRLLSLLGYYTCGNFYQKGMFSFRNYFKLDLFLATFLFFLHFLPPEQKVFDFESEWFIRDRADLRFSIEINQEGQQTNQQRRRPPEVHFDLDERVFCYWGWTDIRPPQKWLWRACLTCLMRQKESPEFESFHCDKQLILCTNGGI